MKIVVVGAQGFVGSSLTKYLSNGHSVIPIAKESLDLLDARSVRDFLFLNKPDVIVNAAATMKNNDLIDDTRNNLGLFMTLHQYRDWFGKLINLGSGAEFDRELDINTALESDIFKVMPKDSYGFGQNMKSRICHDTKNFYTIRIFNCFGLNEIPTRIFPRFLNKGDSILEITNDRYFDYFSIQDLCTVVENCCVNDWVVPDVNAVYQKKYLISEVLNKFCELNNLDPNFKVVSKGKNNYTGNGDLLELLGISLSGLEHGLKEYNE